jgi:hypothetical protein
MGPIHGGLSEEQQNDCRAALHHFAETHGLSSWQMVVKVEETTAEKYSIKIEITPPADSGLPKWPIQEIAVADAAFDVAAEVDKTLELAFQAAFPHKKVP